MNNFWIYVIIVLILITCLFVFLAQKEINNIFVKRAKTQAEYDLQYEEYNKEYQNLVDEGILNQTILKIISDQSYLGRVVTQFLQSFVFLWKKINEFTIVVQTENIPHGYYAKVIITTNLPKEIELLIDNEWMKNSDISKKINDKQTLTKLGELKLKTSILKKLKTS
jgi:YbbR domain-containing protein